MRGVPLVKGDKAEKCHFHALWCSTRAWMDPLKIPLSKRGEGRRSLQGVVVIGAENVMTTPGRFAPPSFVKGDWVRKGTNPSTSSSTPMRPLCPTVLPSSFAILGLDSVTHLADPLPTQSSLLASLKAASPFNSYRVTGNDGVPASAAMGETGVVDISTKRRQAVTPTADMKVSC